jgi:CelD/BcsL family acetyltransferase involved in cellulose biosynthesis
MMTRETGFEEFMTRKVPKKGRQESTRLMRKLEREHNVKVVAAGDAANVRDLLELEMAGWKGREGTAIACQESTRKFFDEMTRDMARAGRLQSLSLQVEGKTVASKLNLLSGSHGFAFKIAFDESLARFSPGMLLEVENIRHLHESTNIQSMDSCADPDHPMINHLWPERRGIESLLVSLGTRRGNWLMAIRPLVQQIFNSLGRKK